MPETSQTMAEMKLKASAAFHRLQLLLWVMPPQCQMLPQLNLWIASTRIPKAANQAIEMTMSTVHLNADQLLFLKGSSRMNGMGRLTRPGEER